MLTVVNVTCRAATADRCQNLEPELLKSHALVLKELLMQRAKQYHGTLR